jgi:raffinose/stachyose/melibiose transport system permease protein
VAASSPASRLASRVVIYLILGTMAAVFLYPVALMILTAFKSTPEIFRNPFGLPESWSLATFQDVWRRAKFGLYLRNSLLITGASALLLLATAAPAAYALARYSFRLRGVLFLFFLAGIMIPIRLGILPLYLLMRDLGLIDTPFSLILTYTASGMPMSVFLLSVFFRNLPRELEDAARIDGCSEGQTFWRIMLPLVRPGLATVVIVNVVPWWNDFFFPLLFIQSDTWKTIPLGMQIFFGQHLINWSLVFSGMVLASLPLLIIYLLMSRQFIAGSRRGRSRGDAARRRRPPRRPWGVPGRPSRGAAGQPGLPHRRRHAHARGAAGRARDRAGRAAHARAWLERPTRTTRPPCPTAATPEPVCPWSASTGRGGGPRPRSCARSTPSSSTFRRWASAATRTPPPWRCSARPPPRRARG